MDAKLKTMIDGGAAIFGNEWLDEMAQTDYGSEIRTCYNRNHLGTKDIYIGWIHDSGKPADITYRQENNGQMTAFGSFRTRQPVKASQGDDSGFTLTNDPQKPKHKRGDFHSQERTLQKVLIDGLNCLPGQQDLF